MLAKVEPSRGWQSVFWRVNTSAVGPSRRAAAYSQANADSTVSQGRQVERLGVVRRFVSCSTGWWVGPSSPRAGESWV